MHAPWPYDCLPGARDVPKMAPPPKSLMKPNVVLHDLNLPSIRTKDVRWGPVLHHDLAARNAAPHDPG